MTEWNKKERIKRVLDAMANSPASSACFLDFELSAAYRAGIAEGLRLAETAARTSHSPLTDEVFEAIDRIQSMRQS